MEADHLCGLNSLVYIHWKIQNKPIKYFSFVFLLSRVMNELCTTHLLWTGISDVQGSFWSPAYSAVFFASGLVESLITNTLSSVLQAGTPFIKSITQRLQFIEFI